MTWTLVPRSLIRAALPLLLAIAAFVVVTYVTERWRPERSSDSPSLDQPVRDVAFHGVPLQVAVHNLVEHASSGTAIRVCRSLTSQRVNVTVAEPQSLRAVLETLAAQAGSRLVVAVVRSDRRPLPTIPCPSEPGGYVVIGGIRRGNP
jgi:hypothetical protein